VGRVRGISTSPFSTTRNLFSSITAADSYNFSRIEVASGAQSMLYSLGQPAGLADVSLNSQGKGSACCVLQSSLSCVGRVPSPPVQHATG
jgi:outer membrane receptor protein involved in Fe transport